jgi:hypothetical protein
MNAYDYRSALPNAIESRRGTVRGAILVAGFLKPSQFTKERHGLISETIGAIVSEGQVIQNLRVVSL